MCPVPIKRQRSLIAFLDDVAIYKQVVVPGQGNLYPAGTRRHPPCAREAVLGRVDGIAGALTGEVCNKQVNALIPSSAVAVVASQKIPIAKGLPNILVDLHVISKPSSESVGERSETLPCGYDFATVPGLQEQGGGKQQSDH